MIKESLLIRFMFQMFVNHRFFTHFAVFFSLPSYNKEYILETSLISISGFDKVIMKLKHEQLSEVEYTKPSINGMIENNVCFSEIDRHHIFIKDLEVLKVWFSTHLT